ncbi:4-hydroxy-tetrahydrodipicolinate synthase [Flavobacteriaceae bacterium F08102]|nr:4-hydroxy-tetrahydrodipicolinate synthase [Flavobacteriaceae bacterium F08102]
MSAFVGTGVALVTPFKEDLSVDYQGLERLVNFQINNGVDYLVVQGTTGEPATLTFEEKALIRSKIISVNKGRLPLILGIGGNNTAAVIQEIKDTDLRHFDAILSVSPYYNKPTQEGIYQHFKAIAEVSPIPIILYNVPGRTAVNMLPETVLRLASDFSTIIGVKEAAGSIEQAMRLIQNSPKDFLVISGDDMIALPMTLCGGAGVISVIGQGLPKNFSAMIKLALMGETKQASALHYDLMNSIDYIFEEGNPAGIKFLLSCLGICNPYVRLPLVGATPVLQEKIRTFVSHYK